MADYYPHLVKTNFTTSDGIDLGEKLITKDYLLSSYPYLLDSISLSSLFFSGQLSYASDVTILTQNRVFGKVKEIASSKWRSSPQHFNLLIKSDGSLWSWGNNTYGQLGTGNKTSYQTFVQVFYDDFDNYNWKQVYCGTYSTVAIKTDGSLWATGYNNEYQLGLGDRTLRTLLTQIGGEYNWKYACIGDVHGLAIKEDGSLWSWGTNRNGLLGRNISSSSTFSSTPVRIGTDNDWIYISTNPETACAIKSDGSLYIWGKYSGWGSTGSNYITPIKIFGADITSPSTLPSGTTYDDWKWKAMSFGYSHAAAIRSDGTLWSIGDNTRNALGLNSSSPSYSNTFRQIVTKGIWKQVDCANHWSAAIRSDGTLWNWGNNFDGQLSRGFTSTSSNIGKIDGYWTKVSCQIWSLNAIKTYDYI
jgi:alpha-tubulin suppressor-like RCC1 family protein